MRLEHLLSGVVFFKRSEAVCLPRTAQSVASLGFSIVIHALARPERGEAFTYGRGLIESLIAQLVRAPH